MNYSQLQKYAQDLKLKGLIFIFSILATFLLVIGVQIIIAYLESDLDRYINISGRQRMLSQKIAYLRSHYSQTSHPELIQSINTFEHTHQKLAQNEFDDIKSYYDSTLNNKVQDYLVLINNPTTELNLILIESQNILSALDRAVHLFEKQNDKFDQYQIQLNLLFLVLICFLLFFTYQKVVKVQKQDVIKMLEMYAEQKNKADQASKAKSLFLANMSHELRTPLNSVIGLSQALISTKLDQEQEKLLKSINQSGSYLLNIVNDILQFTEVDNNNERTELNFSLQSLVKEVTHTFGPQAELKNLELTYTTDKNFPEQIVSDRIKIKQILHFLIDNAIKFTNAGHIRIETSLIKNQVQISVIDTGIGINLSNQQDIFQDFTQIENPYVKSNAGTGMGLAIAKKLSHILNGNLIVESELSKGSTFKLILPFQKSNFLELNNELKSKELTISQALIVEDNKVNQLVLSKMLESFDINSKIAENGADAINTLANERFDLIFMDISMPYMDGFETASRIRKFDSETPIFCVSANVLTTDKERAFKAGMNEFLEKPIQKSELSQLLKKYFLSSKIS